MSGNPQAKVVPLHGGPSYRVSCELASAQDKNAQEMFVLNLSEVCCFCLELHGLADSGCVMSSHISHDREMDSQWKISESGPHPKCLKQQRGKQHLLHPQCSKTDA